MPNEWNITAQSATWITEICTARPDLPFSHATVEETVKRSAKRHDLVLFDRNNKKVLTGEVKRPENPDGRNPMSNALLEDAFLKASRSGIPYFFTWNINRCVLFDGLKNAPLIERDLEHFYVLQPPIKKSDELRDGRREAELKKFLIRFLERFAAISVGREALPTVPLDEKFLLVWEAALEQPVAQTLGTLYQQCSIDREFTVKLNTWMREKLGLILSDDPEIRADNLETAAKFSCYVLANRIIFYKALRRNPRFKRLRVFRISDDITTGTGLKTLLDNYFNHAREITHDYETIFVGDFGDTLPFLSDVAADSWRDLYRQTDAFDFTQLGYEIIGQIFERLLSPEERHRFGQHYTRSEIVDLINTFCIRDADAVVYDPACDGGTFLVRAYARKKELAGGTLGHQELLSQLLGSDISAYPAHLTTINLATRDLIDAANYPFVLRADFFDLKQGEIAFNLPLAQQGNLLEAREFPLVDAVVGNPPYIRQEKIGEYYGSNYKTRLLQIANNVSPDSKFTARSDIHCFFFPHAYTFLNEGGRIGFLVSSSWLDTNYGFRLQKFLLDHFRIVALVESSGEPWFTGARVTTVAVILQREDDAKKRSDSTVRFVWAMHNIVGLIQYAGDEPSRRTAFEALRNAIETMIGSESFEMSALSGQSVEVKQGTLEGWRVRLVRQGDLEQLGHTNIAPPDEEDSDEGNGEVTVADLTSISPAEYIGSKWGLFLRAPNIFFELLKIGGSRFIQLNQLADVKFGLKSGCDAFFFPRDVTEEALAEHPEPQDFRTLYGLARADTNRLRLIEAGDGTRHVIEAEYLEPEVHSLMEIHSIAIDPTQLRRQVLLVDKPKEKLTGKRVLEYIEWGEAEGFHLRSTCASRELWFDVVAPRKPGLIVPKLQQYRHIVLHNSQGLRCSSALLDVIPVNSNETELLGAILNSTIVVLMKHFYARLHGREGSLQLDVYACKILPVPDPRYASDGVKSRLISAFEQMKMRQTGALIDVDGSGSELSGELALTDRQELDDATLELLGVTDADERTQLRSALYDQITRLYREIRRGERSMQRHRNNSVRRTRPTAKTLAGEIWDNLDAPPAWKTPADFLSHDEPCECIDLPPGKVKVVQQTLFRRAGVQAGATFLETGDLARAHYLKAHASAQLWGIVKVPIRPDACDPAIVMWREHMQAQNALFEAEAAARTVDAALQKRIVAELWKLRRTGGQE
ncbi:type I restriction-modification system methyltransferase subunit-like protein [Cylindrospermum sp. NIES-4074]|nr:type I restriction-modification system methyltransferase subunit-like protein [Cylindrospermum sp. NIES-4074]